MTEKLKQFKKDVTDKGETSIEELRERIDFDVSWEGMSWGLEWLDKDFIREFSDRILWDHVSKWDDIDKDIIQEFLHDIEQSVDRIVFEEYVLPALNRNEE